MATALKFQEITPQFDVSFWHELENQKLHHWKLDEPTVPISGWIPAVTRMKHQMPNHASFSKESFIIISGNLQPPPQKNMNAFPGSLQNFNTLDGLVSLDKKKALHSQGEAILAAIQGGKWDQLQQTKASLTGCCMFTFADLKTHKFYYISAFPTLDWKDSPVKCHPLYTAATAKSDGNVLSMEQLQQVHQHAAKLSADEAKAATGACPFFVRKVGKDKMSFSDFSPDAVKQLSGDDDFLAFTDSSSLPEYPGWALRNILSAVRAMSPGITKVRVLCLRGEDPAATAFLDCECDALPSGEALKNFRAVGWTETKINSIDLSAMMDPVKLADSSAKLNLSLMKWRMLPQLELDGLQSCKALLLGSGTLGCNIARHLLMWGVRTITLVDRGTVSFSNPVRQTLFEMKDALAEGEDRVKSVAAANALKRILPSADVKGLTLTIRMPGHRVDPDQREVCKKDVSTLEDLIKSHDMVFLLTDSRESRWLPSLIAAAHNKPVINSALGFDSYMVMRHGMAEQGDKKLGCYFCNDVVAPIDSLTARTLDQQCTVTRPGVSAMASAISVEILAALYNHPLKFACPAYQEDGPDETNTCLGIIPHQVRGSVSDYGSMTMYGSCYSRCTACSKVMTDAYLKEGFDFVLKCLNTPDYMEELTGLKAEKEKAQLEFANWDDDDMDDSD